MPRSRSKSRGSSGARFTVTTTGSRIRRSAASSAREKELRRSSERSRLHRRVEAPAIAAAVSARTPAERATRPATGRYDASQTAAKTIPPADARRNTAVVARESCPCSKRRSPAVGVYFATRSSHPPRPAARKSSAQVPIVKASVTIAALAAPSHTDAAASATAVASRNRRRCPRRRFASSGAEACPPAPVQKRTTASPAVHEIRKKRRRTPSLTVRRPAADPGAWSSSRAAPFLFSSEMRRIATNG